MDKLLMKKIVLIISMVTYLGCNQSTSKYIYYNQKVNELGLSLRILVADIEEYRSQHNHYPNIESNEFTRTFLKKSFSDKSTIDAFSFRSADYIPYDDDFELKIISYICNNNLCTVIKINKNGVYWKDCMAKVGDTIPDINWQEVNSIALPTIRNKDGSYDGSGDLKINDYRRQCP